MADLMAASSGSSMPGPATARERHDQAVFDSAVDFAMIVTDRSGRVTDWNAGAAHIFGWPAAEMLGEPIALIFTPEDRAGGRPGMEMRQALVAGRAENSRWHQHRDGSRLWASGGMTPLRSPGGAHLGFLTILQDRTEQHLAAGAQQVEAEFLRSVLASSGDCIKVLDLDAKLVFMTDVGQRIMEVSDFNAIRGCSWPDFWKGRGNADAWAAIEAAIAGGVGRFEGKADTMAGTPRYWDVQVTPILGASGRPERLLSVSRDITVAKAGEAALKDLADTLEQQVERRTSERDHLWQLSDDLIVTGDYEGALLRVSPSWTRLLGHSDDALLTMCYKLLVHPDDARKTRNALLAMRSGGQSISFENRMLATDGTVKWLSWRLSPKPGRKRFTGVGRDITAAKAREAELAASQDALRQAQKMEAVGQLTGGLAHDFNNLLTGINGNLEMLQMRMGQGRVTDLERYIAAAQVASKRAAALTHRLLAFSRRQTLAPKPTDINRLVAGMEDLIRRTAGPQVAVEVKGAGDLWTTLVDPNQLENALLNLCINAGDAMPDGGRLTIETANTPLDEPAAHGLDLPPGQYVSLSVGDTGTGMTPEVIRRAFDPFFTTKPIGMGTGLGLSMIYGFMQQSGGQARIDSELGRGTTVRLYLPRHFGEAMHDNSAAKPAEAPRASQDETVLVVDDEPAVRMLVSEVLSDLGYTTIEAEDGAAGLVVLRSGVRIDLLVSDVGLPGGMNGRQMADAARLVRPDLKVLFITGYAESAVMRDGQLDAGMHVMTKPFALEALAGRIKGLIAAG